MDSISQDHPSVQIAVIKEQINGIRAQQAAHAQETRNQFKSIEEFQKETNTTLSELVAVMNRGKGAYAASLAIAGIIGGGFIKLISVFWPAGGHQ